MGFSDMVSWASGPGMIQAPELEEGEIYDYEDDKRTNPDIALSDIGDRIQSLQGHFQKDFQGGVSAENLGPKFGGCSSFLPMHKRSHTDAETFIGKAELPRSKSDNPTEQRTPKVSEFWEIRGINGCVCWQALGVPYLVEVRFFY